MTNFVRSGKQVLVRQDAEMDICSSRMLGMKVEWWGRLKVAHVALYNCGVCGTFLRKPRQTSDKDNVNRTERKK